MKTHEIVLLQGAQSDLLSIYQTLGERAYARVDKALGILRVFPTAGPAHFGNHIRRLVVSKIPLGVFYALAGRCVLVAAILDLRKSPESIQKRLTSQWKEQASRQQFPWAHSELGNGNGI